MRIGLRRPPRGFSLVEMMISVVLGLIVIGSVITLVVATMRSNTQNIQSTRLTQELRAILDVVTRDVRRARYSPNAINRIGAGAIVTNPYQAFVIANRLGAPSDSDGNAATVDGDCVTYSYAGTPAGSAASAALQPVFRAIWLDNTGAAPNSVRVATAAVPVACADGAGAAINSSDVEVTRLTFNQDAANDTVVVTVEARLRADTNVRRRMSEVVRIRSS